MNYSVCSQLQSVGGFQDDPDDLPFKKGDVMTVLRKDEDEWWFAQHEDGRQGSIPVPYIQIVSLGLVYCCNLVCLALLINNIYLRR